MDTAWEKPEYLWKSSRVMGEAFFFAMPFFQHAFTVSLFSLLSSFKTNMFYIHLPTATYDKTVNPLNSHHMTWRIHHPSAWNWSIRLLHESVYYISSSFRYSAGTCQIMCACSNYGLTGFNKVEMGSDQDISFILGRFASY